ncbi:transglutaminase domain-containing protein [Caldivirga maquilingensis]|uniref:Transglutaminase domain-containing protein n=1 Tax=Caldivirga maquilingensis (strain ATCC 700844 / DSM 13496 / JCM 10307 / IC-167) TaxID=397948 RepID=A8MC72_CALMQ|nr:transglutaminase domain-containing protein [Caldivirga maquilingensis]ABW01378.1 hypothetical protein Cmaq_0534 [Caldivirga maquilingensis IC-167]
MLILLSLKLMAYALLSIMGNASCVMVPSINNTVINLTLNGTGFELTLIKSNITVTGLNLTLNNYYNVSIMGKYAEEFMKLGEAYCEGSFGKMYIIGNNAYFINSTSSGLIVGVTGNLTINEVSMTCPMVPALNTPYIKVIYINGTGCLITTKLGGGVHMARNMTSVNLMLNGFMPIPFKVTFSGIFNTYTYGGGLGLGNAFPTSVLLVTKSAELVARVESSAPFYLRFYVFDNVTKGYSLNYTLKPIVSFETIPYTVVMFTGNVTDCRVYNVTVYLIHPENIIPIPIPVNENESFVVARYVEIEYTNPPSSLLYLIEPGKVLMVSNPVSEVGYSVEACKATSVEAAAINDPYALLYRSTVKLPVTINATTPMKGALAIFKLFNNDTVKELLSNALNYPWSPLVASAAAMYLYRASGYPARVILGTIPVKYDGEYLEYGYLPWVELYYGGWIDFKPYRGLPVSPNGGGLGALFTKYGIVNYVGVSVLLVLPALLIYYLYLYLTARGVYSE